MRTMKSSSAKRTYAKKVAELTTEQAQLVDSIYHWAEENYEEGGDTIVDCYTPAEILESFTSLEDAIETCGIIKSRREDIEGMAF